MRISACNTCEIAQAQTTLSISDSSASIYGADVDRVEATAGYEYVRSFAFPYSQTLYVDQAAGDDSNTGLSEASAYATIQKAVTEAAAGTRVLVKDGIYKEQVTFPRSGTASAPIQVLAMQGHSPVISGAKDSASISTLGSGALETKYTDFEVATVAETGFSISNPVSESTDTTVEIDTRAANAANGNRSLVFSYPNASPANKGISVKKTLVTGGATKAEISFSFALSSNFAMVADSRMDILHLIDTANTRVARIVMRQVAAGILVQVLDSTGSTVVYNSQTDAFYLPKGAYTKLTIGYDSANTSAPISFKLNGVAKTTGSQAASLGTAVLSVQMGSIHSTSGSVSYPTATSKIFIDALAITLPTTDAFPGATIAENDFESSISDFSSTSLGSNSIALSTAEHKHGAQSVLYSFAGTSAVNGLSRSITVADNVYVRFFLKLKDFDLNVENSNIATNSSRWNLLTLGEDSTDRVVISLVKHTHGMKLDARVLTPWSSTVSNFYTGYPAEIKNDEWVQVELRFKGNSATGGSELWLRGTSIAGNYDRTQNPDAYAGLDTSGLRINKITLGESVEANSAARPVVNSKLYIDGFRVEPSIPSGLTPNGQSLNLHKTEFLSSDYTNYGTSSPSLMIVTDSVYPEGKIMSRVPDKAVVSPGTFAVENRAIYFRPYDDGPITTKKFSYGVRDTGFLISDKSHIVVAGFNIYGMNHGNQGAVYMAEGAQYNAVINNLLQANAGAGVRIEGAENGTTVTKPGYYNNVIGNHFRDNLLPFGSGIRFDDSGYSVVENNTFESEMGTNISVECFTKNVCRGISIRRNKFLSAGESNIYIAKYVSESAVYSNILRGARSSGYHTMKLGVRGSSGGSGVHIARASDNNIVYNNVIYDVDTAGVSLRAKVRYNKVLNNTIVKFGVKGAGVGIDYAKDDNEAALADTDGNGIPDGQEDVEYNISFNNIVGYSTGTNRCVDLEGYDAYTSVDPKTFDTSNIFDYQLYYNCARVALFNSQSYPEESFAAYVAATLSIGGLQREASSKIFTKTVDLFEAPNTHNYRLLTPRPTGACSLKTTCPWTP